MIKYHGLPFSGTNSEASEALIGRHAFCSFADTSQLEVALEVCQSIALDNGAFSHWRKGTTVDWDTYFTWAAGLMNHPRVDFAVIPDVIDGTEGENEALINQWCSFFGSKAEVFGAPVWHMHESREKLTRLVTSFPRIAVGSSSEYSSVGSEIWHQRMTWAMQIICDDSGRPKSKVHMLRGLDPAVFTKYPFASADSTNAARNCMAAKRWNGTYAPPSNSWRARVIMARIEASNSPHFFDKEPS